MAGYTRRRRSSVRSRSRYSPRRPARRVGRRKTARRQSTQRVVIQVIGGAPGGMVPVSATLGKKAPRTLRPRY